MNSNNVDERGPQGMGWLFGLLLATFAIGTDDFIIAGILPEIASDLQVGEAVAGQLVTVFSVTYAAAAPVLAVATARVPRRPLIVGGLTAFAVVNFVTAVVTSYPLLMALRVAAALVAATVSPAAFAVAGTLAPPERTGRAIATVAAGLTVSLVVGVPTGSWLSETFGWQSTFICVGMLTCLAVAATATTLPRLPDMPVVGVRARLVLLRRPPVLACVLGTVVGASSGLMPYIYIAPVTHDLTGLGSGWVSVFIVVYGVAGAVGTVVGGRLTDRWGIDRALLSLLGVVVLSTVAMTVVGLLAGGRAAVWLICLLLAVWGMAGWAYNPPMNARALQMAGEAGTEAVALNTSGLYVGIALAGMIGGGALSRTDGTGVLAAAAVIGVVNLAFMTATVRHYPARRPETEPRVPATSP
ncbi:MFS transporter [Actinomadura sp. NBRC 104425]|uniref:MFS transporter n=1 Tax=Actinomadura sp. NBRC 104425 TaxID=3032204 RepID=UPI0024A48360|nr:MFS transporter [Actinomadura sp. NBRC 104425]GLZ15807.1 MFS transporter [Actinomadura sp. NBRC 104425]